MATWIMCGERVLDLDKVAWIHFFAPGSINVYFVGGGEGNPLAARSKDAADLLDVLRHNKVPVPPQPPPASLAPPRR